MTREDILRRFPNASESFIRNNVSRSYDDIPLLVINKTKKQRVRQSPKPLMNKLEAEFFAILSAQYPNYSRPRAQAKRYRLGNGVTFTPDITASTWPRLNGINETCGADCETAWEVKGDRAWDDAIVKVKMAAAVWPEVRWILVWKENGHWNEQEILT